MTDPQPGSSRMRARLRWLVRTPLFRLLLSIVFFGVVANLGMFALDRLHQLPKGFGDRVPPRAEVLPELWLALVSVVVLLLVGRKLERASYAELGVPRQSAGKQVGAGFALGTALLSVVILTMTLAGWYRAMPSAFATIVGPFFWSIVLFLLVAIFEEVFFRGIGFRLLEQCIGSWGAVLLTAAFFGYSHHNNPNATWVASVGIAVEAGVLLGAAYLLFRALWLPIGLHWAWNLFEGPVFGTPVSGMDLPHVLNASVNGPVLWTGGAFGPEAGLLCMLLGGVLGGALMIVAQRRGRLYTPPWMRRLFTRAPEAPPGAGDLI